MCVLCVYAVCVCCMYMRMCVCVYVCMCVCEYICMFMCVREREKKKRGGKESGIACKREKQSKREKACENKNRERSREGKQEDRAGSVYAGC